MAQFTTNLHSFNNIDYLVTATEEIHTRLINDPDFKKLYFTQNNNEIVGVSEEPQQTSTKEVFSWNKKSTLLLIQLFNNMKMRFRDPKVKKKQLWNEICQALESHGYLGVNEEIVDRKWRNLKKTYKTIKDNNNKKNTGRSRVQWDHYEIFEEIYADDRTVNFGPTISSMDISQPKSTSLPDIPSNLVPESLEELPIQITIPSQIAKPNQIETTPYNSVTQTPTNKNKSGRQLYAYRKKGLQVEEERVQELKKLRLAVEISNKIQERRNILLKKLLNK